MVSFVFVYFGYNQYKEDCAYSTEHGMRYLMHVITVGCIDIYMKMSRSHCLIYTFKYYFKIQGIVNGIDLSYFCIKELSKVIEI